MEPSESNRITQWNKNNSCSDSGTSYLLTNTSISSKFKSSKSKPVSSLWTEPSPELGFDCSGASGSFSSAVRAGWEGSRGSAVNALRVGEGSHQESNLEGEQ